MAPRVIAALRDLDPPAGGAEMSLATLLKGVSESGPLADNAAQYIPLVECEEVGILEDGLGVFVFHSSDRGGSTELTRDSNLDITTTNLRIEGIWSGLAWRLRVRSTGKPNLGLQRRHLRVRNAQFAKWLDSKISDLGGDFTDVVGVTQLDWAPGAASIFKKYGIPYVCFVRDEIQFRHPELFRPALEGAVGICCAGLGLIEQVKERFAIRNGFHVPLPVDYEKTFGSLEFVEFKRRNAMEERVVTGDVNIPRIAIVNPSPEKGLAFYHRLLPFLEISWPEAHIEVYGGGAHGESLQKYGNTEWMGFVPPAEIFDHVDVHLLVFESTGSWGRVTNEGGLFGVPTVCVDLGAQPEAVGNGGVTLPYESTLDEWCAALKDVYSRRKELGGLAKVHAGVIDHRRSISMFRSALHEVLK
ncbi:MAG: glycosyltransferase [Candidatus Thalassarchaeaceae archaeon]|nr:glycosyltransferase [Candidatus Thalassarchaeaceae archaeon]